MLLLLAAGALLLSCVTQQEKEIPPEQRLSALYPADRPFPESRFSTISGLSIHYRAWIPTGETRGKILLLHGIGGSTYSFERVAPLLVADGFAVVAVDLPGFGFSDPALKFEHTPANRLALVWTLIDRLDTDDNQFNPLDRWHVVGHQMGGEFTVWMANDRPGRLKSLTLVATVIGQNRPGGRFAGFPPVRWGLRAWLTNSLYTQAGVAELLEDAYGRPPTQEAIDGYLAPLVRDDADRALVNFARTSGKELPDLGAVQIPVLCIWGNGDNWRSLEDGQLQAQQYQGITVKIINGAGHVPMDTHPQEFAAILSRWIASVESAAR